jgi:uncharacterized protein YigE (DUF2233 family)
MTLRSNCAVVIACQALLAGVSAGQTQWTNAAHGVRLANVTCRTRANRTVTATVVLANPRVVDLRVVDVYQTLGSASASLDYSLDEVFAKVKPIAVINGGDTASFTLPAAVGLLVTNGKTRSPLNKQAAEKSGVICFGELGRSVLEWAYNFHPYGCKSGLQAAPVLLLDGASPRFATDNPTARSIIGFTNADEIFLMQVDAMTLGDLVTQVREKMPFVVTAALCLGGSSSSGLIVRGGGAAHRWGSTRTLIASAIVVESGRPGL